MGLKLGDGFPPFTGPDGEPGTDKAAPGSPVPGQKCPTCGVPAKFPKGPKSPPTRKISYYIQTDSYDDHQVLIEAVADHIGVEDQPFRQAKAVTAALVRVLQDESLKDFARREWVYEAVTE